MPEILLYKKRNVIESVIIEIVTLVIQDRSVPR